MNPLWVVSRGVRSKKKWNPSKLVFRWFLLTNPKPDFPSRQTQGLEAVFGRAEAHSNAAEPGRPVNPRAAIKIREE